MNDGLVLPLLRDDLAPSERLVQQFELGVVVSSPSQFFRDHTVILMEQFVHETIVFVLLGPAPETLF